MTTSKYCSKGMYFFRTSGLQLGGNGWCFSLGCWGSRICGALLSLVLSLTFLSAQKPYDLKTGPYLGYTAIGAGLNGISLALQSKIKPLTIEQINSLDEKNIWKPDRWVVKQFSTQAQHISDRFLYASFAVPFTLALDKPARRTFGKVGLIYLQTLLLNYGISNVAKSSVKRARPFMYNDSELVPLELKLKKAARYSFFSSHTSFTAALSFLTAKLHHDLYPENRSKIIWGLAAIIPAYTGMQRIRGGKHFLTDVITGYLVGAAIGILVPELYRN